MVNANGRPDLQALAERIARAIYRDYVAEGYIFDNMEITAEDTDHLQAAGLEPRTKKWDRAIDLIQQEFDRLADAHRYPPQ